MTFDEVLAQVRELLEREGRVSYRALKRRFALDDEYLEDLKAELIDAKQLATDEDGNVLVWVGASPVPSSEFQVSSSPHSPAPGTQPPVGERRQLTVMFCDIVGSTALSTQLDPEELQEVVVAYQETCTEVIRRYAGYTAQHLGDGLLVYFGYPAAHEDDAQRAVRTGLEIIQALRGQEKREPLHVRIGIHTGLVVIGEIGSSEKREILALGETPNLAARIQGQANPDEVMISAATYRLVEGLFECEDRGQPELKGVATPWTLYRVRKESEAQSRFEVVVRRGLTPLVGRDHELGLLKERWAQARDGTGQVVLLRGEPGIGKSRLMEALKETVEYEGTRCWELRCSPYHQNSALYPVIEHLQRALGFQGGDASEQKLQKLVQALERLGQSDVHVIASGAKQSLLPKEIASSPLAPRNDTARLQEVIPLFAALLSLPHPQNFPPLTLSPQKQKEKTYEALVAWLCAEATQQGVIYVWEDLHWADPSTLELLTLFLNQVPTSRLLALLTFRPEFMSPWDAHSYLSQLTLSRLGRNHVEAMVKKVTGGQALPHEIVQQIVSKTDGVPLFVEELTKTVLESVESMGSIESIGSAIPTTLQDSLMARLDRLGRAKEIAQLGAMIGREFAYELLQAVSSLNEEALQQGLLQLVKAELVFQTGMPPQAQYLFKHALVQDTAYQSLLKSHRQQLHQQVVQVLIEQFPQTVETQPELVAHHYTEAGLAAQAIRYWQKAGERSVDRSAYVEAISHLSRGLELLKTLPDTRERSHQELNLQTPLGLAFMATKWYGAPEVGKAYTRARELCRQLGETPQLAQALYGLWIIHLVWGELPTAYEAAEQLLRLGENIQDSALIIEGHHGLGQILYYMGKFAAARDHLEQAIAFYDSRQSSSLAIRPIQDPGVLSRGYAAWTLWFLGYPDQALQKVCEAFALAQKLSHPLSLGFALNFASTLHQFRKEEQLAQEWAEAVRALASEHGSLPTLFYYSGRKSTFMAFASEHDFTQFGARGTFMRGAMLAAQDQVEEGLTQLRQSVDTYLAGGNELLRPIFLSGLAAAHGTVGQIDEGLTLVTEALTVLNKAGQRLNEAGLYLLKGSLLLKSGDKKVAEAEECFRQALDVARRQGAKSLELQAATSLARLWEQQGKKAEAHKLLSEIYNWFTEGFDTKDLQEAKALLDSLESSV